MERGNSRKPESLGRWFVSNPAHYRIPQISSFPTEKMSYRPIKYARVSSPALKEVFHRADLLLADVYGMFPLPVANIPGGGGCNYSITLVLLCVIDGIAGAVYPTHLVKDQEKRFKKLIRDKLPWGLPKDGWINKGEAASLLYLEFRNTLVHQLGKDAASKARRDGFEEPIVGKWGRIPASHQHIVAIDALKSWNDKWPILFVQSVGTRRRMKLCAAALYWSVKRMIQDIASDKKSLQ